MKKAKVPEKKQSAGAPAYMLQYTALMTILLAFFILMLTMGHERVAGYMDGVGEIKNLLELQGGGTGVMNFWRSMRKPGLPKKVKEDAHPDAQLVGYEKDAVDQYSLDATSIQKIEFVDDKKTLRLLSSIRFEPGQARMDRKTQFALDQAVATIYSLKNYQVVVCVLVDTGHPEADRLLAAQRAAWLVRNITAQTQIPLERIRALGQVGTLVDAEGGEPVEVLLLLRDKGGDGKRV